MRLQINKRLPRRISPVSKPARTTERHVHIVACSNPKFLWTPYQAQSANHQLLMTAKERTRRSWYVCLNVLTRKYSCNDSIANKWTDSTVNTRKEENVQTILTNMSYCSECDRRHEPVDLTPIEESSRKRTRSRRDRVLKVRKLAYRRKKLCGWCFYEQEMDSRAEKEANNDHGLSLLRRHWRSTSTASPMTIPISTWMRTTSTHPSIILGRHNTPINKMPDLSPVSHRDRL